MGAPIMRKRRPAEAAKNDGKWYSHGHATEPVAQPPSKSILPPVFVQRSMRNNSNMFSEFDNRLHHEKQFMASSSKTPVLNPFERRYPKSYGKGKELSKTHDSSNYQRTLSYLK